MKQRKHAPPVVPPAVAPLRRRPATAVPQLSPRQERLIRRQLKLLAESLDESSRVEILKALEPEQAEGRTSSDNDLAELARILGQMSGLVTTQQDRLVGLLKELRMLHADRLFGVKGQDGGERRIIDQWKRRGMRHTTRSCCRTVQIGIRVDDRAEIGRGPARDPIAN